MAIWKSENAMLTKRGVEILNKIKAGIGGITVTKIAVSSGRVAPSKLYNSTDLTGSQKNMELSQKITDAVGSELSVYITNTGFVAPFTINQIGVYVTHPDYSGNQLYYIAQCEEGNPDILPIFDETPVTLGYSLYLEHGNSSAITIEVSTQGVVTVEAFDQFKEGLTTTLESKADLVGGTLPISQLPPGLTDGRGGIKKFLTSETDPTVPSWAKQSSKPSYTASEVGAASKVHKHNASDIDAGTLSSDRLPLVPVTKGGTGASTAQDARTNLGAAPVSHKHSTSDITSGTFSTDRLPVVPITKGGTGATDKATALSNLGGAPVKHTHNASDIKGGILDSSLFPTIPISKGGTNATTAGQALTNLGAAPKSHKHAASDIESGVLSSSLLPTVPVAKGGTGATSASQALSNLGAAPSSHKHSAGDITSGTLSSSRLPTVPISKGGTNATTAEQALINLGAAKVSHTHTSADITDGIVVKTINGVLDVADFAENRLYVVHNSASSLSVTGKTGPLFNPSKTTIYTYTTPNITTHLILLGYKVDTSNFKAFVVCDLINGLEFSSNGGSISGNVWKSSYKNRFVKKVNGKDPDKDGNATTK